MALHSLSFWQFFRAHRGDHFSFKGRRGNKEVATATVGGAGAGSGSESGLGRSQRVMSQPLSLQLIERKKPSILPAVNGSQFYHRASSNKMGDHKILKKKGSDPYYRPVPRYPAEALKQEMEGELIVEVHTDEAGWVKSIHLEQSTGYSILDTEALQTVKRWRLTPHSVFHIPFHFKIVGKNLKQIDHGRQE